MDKLKDAKYNWLIILTLILIAPLGLFFIVKYRPKWWANKVIKVVAIVLTVFFGIMCIGAMVNPQTDNGVTNTPTTETKEVEVKEAIKYETERKDDPNLAKGEEKVITEGVEGERIVVYEVKYEDGKEVTRNKISETITKEPINEIIAVGTYVVPTNTTPSNPSNNSSSSNNSPSSGVDYTVSGYCNDGSYVTGDPSAKGRASACYGHGGWRDY